MQYKPRFFKWSKKGLNLYTGMYYFCDHIKEPFTLDWAIDTFQKNCKIFNPHPDEHINQLLNSSDYFGVAYRPEPVYFPACLLFENTNFVIYPSELEIKENILILGDSLKPYCAANLKLQDIKIYQENNNELIDFKSMACKYQDLEKWFLSPPLSNALLKEILIGKDGKRSFNSDSDKAEYLLVVLELTKIYAENNIKQGDGIMFNVTNYHKGLFNISILKSSPRTNFQFRSIEFQMEIEKNIISNMEESGLTPEVKKSLTNAYARMKLNRSWKNLAPMAWLKYVKKSKKLSIFNIGHDNFLFYGRKENLDLNAASLELSWSCPKMESLSDILETANCEANIEVLKAYTLNYIDKGNYNDKEFFKFIFDKFKVRKLKEIEKLLFKKFAKNFWQKQLSKASKTEPKAQKICREKALKIYENCINFYQNDSLKVSKITLEKENHIYNILIGCEIIFTEINDALPIDQDNLRTFNNMLDSMDDHLNMLKYT